MEKLAHCIDFVLFVFFSFNFTALADKDDNGSLASGFWSGYWHYIKKQAQELKAREDDFWGVQSLTCPEGVFSLKLITNCKRATERYRDDGSKGPIISPISFPDPFGTSNDFMNVNIDMKGSGCGYVFRLFYAVNDPLDVFINFQFQNEDLEMNVKFQPGTSSQIGIRTEEDFYRLLELLGRPRPKTRYKSDSLELADTDAGILYNYFRNDYFSAMVKPRVFFPTGRLADPNSALIFALGPQIDVGKGSYGLGLTHNFDLRPPEPFKWLIFATNINYVYYLRGKHPSPKFLKPDPTAKEFLENIGFESDYFPDLSDLNSYYYVTPGHNLEAVANLMFSKSFLGIGVGYGYLWSQKPIVETSSEEFKKMMDVLNSYSESEAHAISLIVALRLFYFNIPAMLNLEARYPLGGRNYFVFEDDYKLDFQVFFPF